MSIPRHILTAATVLLILSGSAHIYGQDYARLSEQTITGTARYIGMGGAMSAIGGDPSSVHDNPAGLGLYRRMEILLSIDYGHDYTYQRQTAETESRMNGVSVPHASWVISLPTDIGTTGLQYHNIMFSYRRMQAYGRELFAREMQGGASLGALLSSKKINLGIPYASERTNDYNWLWIKERGAVNEFAINWAGNVSNQWYFGIGFHLQSYSLGSDAIYYEEFKTGLEKPQIYYNRNTSNLVLTGLGCSFSAGLIYRPLQWLRVGFGIQTPSIGSINTYTSAQFEAGTDSVRTSSPLDGRSHSTDFHIPMHTSTSVAFQIGYYSMIALQYDYRHMSGVPDDHSLRAGIEVIPVPGFYINAGYAYESSFAKQDKIVPMDGTFTRQDTYFFQPRHSQYASVALGYRGKYAIVQAAYQYKWQETNLYAHENMTHPYDMHADTHRVVVTFGWHR